MWPDLLTMYNICGEKALYSSYSKYNYMLTSEPGPSRTVSLFKESHPLLSVSLYNNFENAQ